MEGRQYIYFMYAIHFSPPGTDCSMRYEDFITKSLLFELLAAPVPGLQQTLGGLHYRSLLRYRLCMQMFPDDASCLSCQAPMDIFADHALLCRKHPSSAGFQLCHRLVQQTLGLPLRQAGITHMVQPQYQRLSRDEGPESGRGSGLTRPANILLYGWRGDRHCNVDLVGVSPARRGWRDAASALTIVKQTSGTNTRRRVLFIDSTSCPSVSLSLALLALQPRSSLTACADDTPFMHVLPSGRPMLGSTVISLFQSCAGWLTSSSATAYILSGGDSLCCCGCCCLLLLLCARCACPCCLEIKLELYHAVCRSG